MSVRSVIGGTIRGLVIAAATAGAAFGALVVFEPFGRTPAPVPAENAASPASAALQQRIEALRLSLRETEQAIEAASAISASGDAVTRAQYEAQIAAAIERRDLALRHAGAIRESLDAGVTPSSLAAIRDSVVIGQMLSQQVALDGQIAVDGARLRPNHPTMRALNAQRDALTAQIRQEAASIASALESEAKVDDTQIQLLQSQLPALTPWATDIASLEARAAAQRTELDGLVDAYFNIPIGTASAPAAAPRDLLSAPNVAVVVVAVIAALLFQLLLAVRRYRTRISDREQWRADSDPDSASLAPATEPQREAA